MPEEEKSRDPALSRYRQEWGAKAYRDKYARSLARRVDNIREHRIISKLLAGTGGELRVLNAACGAGRFAETILGRSREVVFSDFSLAMLEVSRARLAGSADKVAFVAADAIHLPFERSIFDLVVAVRLMHHLRQESERDACLGELLRVSRRWLIITFADACSLKGRSRRFRQRWMGRPRGEAMMSRAELAALAAAHGFRPRRFIPISRLFSTQTYALLEAEDA